MSKQLKLFDMGVRSSAARKAEGDNSSKRKLSKEQYECKRTRKFVPSWTEKYPGLYESDNKLLTHIIAVINEKRGFL